jgi:predicted transcriptional regulator
MKTAISIPDEIFEKAEHLARRMNKSRSQLFSNAVEEYVDRHSTNRVTEALDKALSEVNVKTDSFVAEASHRILENSEW